MMQIENNMVVDQNWPKDTSLWEDAEYEQVVDFMYDHKLIPVAVCEFFYLSDCRSDWDDIGLEEIFGDLEEHFQKQIVEKFRKRHDMDFEFRDWSNNA